MTEFAVIGTDGLWDTLDPQQTINFVRQKILKSGGSGSGGGSDGSGSLQEVARLLCREALARGSVDNITVLIVSFHLGSGSGSGGGSATANSSSSSWRCYYFHYY